MSEQQKRKRPGPAGKSCLTCRTRSKKCDRTRPVCERCKKGRFDCLGYDEPESSTMGSYPGLQVIRLSNEDLWSIGEGHIEMGTNSETMDVQDNLQYDQRAVFLAAGKADGLFGPLDAPSGPAVVTPTSTISPFRVDPSSSSNLLPQTQPGFLSVNLAYIGSSHASSGRSPSLLNSSSGVTYYNSILPQNMSPVPSHLREVLRFIVSSYEQLVNTSFFQPALGQTIRVRESLSWRLQISPTARWSMFLGAKIFEAMAKNPAVRAASYARCHNWIERFEKQMDSIPFDGLTLAQIQNRLGESLEMSLFKLRTTDSINTYGLLKSQAPNVLRIISSDPTFWSDSYNWPKVPLAYVLASDRYEITHFALLDMMCSMAYGVPQVIDYDTSIPLLNTNIHPVEWVHGCSAELQMSIVKINSMCAWNQIGPALDWQRIEQELLDWKPSTQKVPGEESWRLIARLAVRESWRHALLIYLYMSVCGVPSDDPRVSSSVRQVFQITGIVKEKPQPITHLHFSTQFLIAGAYTPNENQRAIARQELSMSIKTGSWLLSGSDFVPVLDHLWHGAAANGRPVRWCDYVCSRQAALPVPI